MEKNPANFTALQPNPAILLQTASDIDDQRARHRHSAIARLWAEDPVETFLLCGLVAGLAWAPFWLGSNRMIPWGVNAILFPSLTIAYEVSLLARGRRHPFGIRRLIVPAFLFVCVVVFILAQMSTLAPPAVVHPIWNMAQEVLGQPLAASISVNRSATSLALMRLLTEASALWLAIQLCRNPARAYFLLQSVVAIVAVYAAYGILLAVFGSPIPLFDIDAASGLVRSTFPNRNNFATFAGLGLISAIALILRLYRHEVPDHGGLSTYRLNKFVAATGTRGWVWLGAAIVILVALLGSLSRGGVLASGLGAFAILMFSMTRKRRRRTEQLEAIVFVALVLVAGFGFFGDLFVGRIASSGFGDTTRASLYAITVRSILDSPFIGFGYGTFADVFPMYRDGSISPANLVDLAHNTYLEVLQGLGLIFGGALIGAVGILVVQCFRGALQRRKDATPAIVAAAASLLVGVHALVDFSIQIQAVTLLFMALLGAGVAESISSRDAISD